MNRKLIRTTLAEVKEREYHQQQVRRAEPPPQPQRQAPQPAASKKKIPPEQTNAESFYYKKQMDAHTPMVVVFQDNEALHGINEWDDKNSIKLHRNEGPNLLVLKHNIKYMYKDESVKESKGPRGKAEVDHHHDDDDYDESDDE